MAGYKGMCLAVLATSLLQGTMAASFQKPLLTGDTPAYQAQPASTADKPLVDSEELQAAISADKLLARAKELFHIAELSRDEYNRPTRVIGSAGEISTLCQLCRRPRCTGILCLLPKCKCNNTQLQYSSTRVLLKREEDNGGGRGTRRKSIADSTYLELQKTCSSLLSPFDTLILTPSS